MKRQFNQDIKVNGSIEANAIGDNLTLALKNFLLSTVYTVGSVFTSFNNDNPNNIFSDTVWVKLPEGTFLMQGGTNFPIKTLENIAESDGGEAVHTLTEEEMPKHAHTGLFQDYPEQPYGSFFFHLNGFGTTGNSRAAALQEFPDSCKIPHTGSTGGGQAHNNLPPYKACNIWVRTA